MSSLAMLARSLWLLVWLVRVPLDLILVALGGDVPPERRALYVASALGCAAAFAVALLGAGVPIVIFRVSDSLAEPARGTFVAIAGGAYLLLMVTVLVRYVVRVYHRHR